MYPNQLSSQNVELQAHFQVADLRQPALRDLVRHWLPPVRRVLAYCAPDPQLFEELINRLKLSDSAADQAVASIVINRKLNMQASLNELLDNRNLIQRLPHYSQIRNLELAARTLLATWQAQQKVGVVGDYDADGITSVAQVVLAARNLGQENNLIWRIPDRFVDGYGISKRIAEDLISNGCRLVMLLDHGIKSNSLISDLQSQGIKVIVIDHHIPGEQLPQAVVVNPEQPGCSFQSEKLCASGLTAYLTLALAEITGQDCINLPLAAVGTIADMVPVFGVNRNIIKLGLQQLRTGSNRPLIQLAELMQIDPRYVGSEEIGFNLAPVLNASGRIAHAKQAVELLISNDPEKTLQLANELVALNEQRKLVQRAGNMLCEQILSEQGRLGSGLVVSSADFHPGVVGLNSAHLAQRYVRPAVVVAKVGDAAPASCRQGDEDTNLVEILDRVAQNSTGVIQKHGGHKAAAGLTLNSSAIDSFRDEFQREVCRQIATSKESLTVSADFEMPLQQLNAMFVRRIDRLLGPYGQGFQPPRILFRGLELVRFIDSPRSITGILSSAGKEVTARFGLEIWDSCLKIGDCLDVIARPVMIFRRQKHQVQLVIEAYNKTDQIGSIRLAEQRALEYQNIFNFAKPDYVESTDVPSSTPNPANRLLSQTTFRFLDDLDVFTTEVASNRRKSETGSSRSTGFLRQRSLNKLSIREIRERAKSFPSDYLYPELSTHFEDPWSNNSPDLGQIYKDFIQQEGLQLIRPDRFQYRTYQAEVVRFTRERQQSLIVEGPTGSGKTEIGLYLAAREIKNNGSVLFVAPTREIAKQTFERARRALNEQVDIVYLDGDTQRTKRVVNYTEHPCALWVAVPHAIKNDLSDQVLENFPWSLLLVDEAHFASKDYPYTHLIKAARSNNGRIVLFSGTPGEPQSTKATEFTWANLEKLKASLGPDAIHFPLNLEPRVIALTPRITDYKKKFLSENNALNTILKRVASAIDQKLTELGTDQLVETDQEKPTAILRALVGKNLDILPSGYSFSKSRIMSVLKQQLSFQPELYRVLSQLYVIKELGETQRRLNENGLYSCQLGALKQLIRLRFPCGSKPPAYLARFFDDYEVNKFLVSISRGPFFGIWRDRRGLAERLGLDLAEFNKLSGRKKLQYRNRCLEEFKTRARREFAELDYSDSQTEKMLFDLLREHAAKRSIVFVKEREQVHFLVSRINAQLSDRGLQAGGLTGKVDKRNHKFKNAEDRDVLDAFQRGELDVLVCTSVAEQGVDFDRVDIGIDFNYSGRLTEALQRAGRLGRDGSAGTLYFIINSGAAHGKFQIVLKKYALNIERQIQERKKLLQAFAPQ